MFASLLWRLALWRTGRLSRRAALVLLSGLEGVGRPEQLSRPPAVLIAQRNATSRAVRGFSIQSQNTLRVVLGLTDMTTVDARASHPTAVLGHAREDNARL
jgi:hypothetical protein